MRYAFYNNKVAEVPSVLLCISSRYSVNFRIAAFMACIASFMEVMAFSSASTRRSMDDRTRGSMAREFYINTHYKMQSEGSQ